MLHSPIRHNSDRHNIEETGGRSSHASRPSVMVCLSPSPSTKRVIRTAARMAFPGPSSNIDGPPPIALYVGSTGREAEEDSLLRENIRYARKYGFEVHTIQGADIPLAIAEYARREEVTDLFLGYSPPSFTLLPRPAINEKLLSCLPTVDIHIVPDPVSSSYPKDMRQRRPGSPNWNLKDLLLVLAVMAVATFLSYWVYMSRFSNSNIITIYILAVLIASVMTSSRIYGTLAAVLYVLLFNFLFIEPRFTLLVYDSAYMMTYLVTVGYRCRSNEKYRACLRRERLSGKGAAGYFQSAGGRGGFRGHHPHHLYAAGAPAQPRSCILSDHRIQRFCRRRNRDLSARGFRGKWIRGLFSTGVR